MRASRVVIDAPGFDQVARRCDAGKPVFIQAFVATLAVEALDEGVLNGLPRPDETQLHAASVGPGVEGAAAEFGTVVHHQDLRKADGLSQAIEDADDAQAR